MLVRVLASGALSKSHPFKNLFSNAFFFTPFFFFSKYPLRRTRSWIRSNLLLGSSAMLKVFPLRGCRWIHSDPFLSLAGRVLEPLKQPEKSTIVGGTVDKRAADLELLQAQAKSVAENKTDIQEIEGTEIGRIDPESSSNFQLNNSDKLKEVLNRNKECSEEGPMMDTGMASDSEDLSDIFETESDSESENKVEQPLYLDKFERFPVESDGECEDFEEHLRQIPADSKTAKSWEKDSDSPNFVEVDHIFLRAASLLKKKRR